MRLRPVLASVAVALAAATVPATAVAATTVRACAGIGATTTVVRDGQFLESSAFDPAGRLVYDDWISGAIRALDTPTTKPRSLGRLRFPGGIDQGPQGRLVIAEGNSFGRLFGGSAVFALDTTTGAKTRLASKMVGGNGLARAADGTLYASDTPASQIDRVAPDGTVTTSWWHGSGGPNGLAVSPDGGTLYVSLSSTSRVVAIETATKAVRTVYRFAGAAPAPDGITLGAGGQLYVALYFAGEVHRIDLATGTACRLARGLTLPTSVALAPPAGEFDERSAYVTSSGAVKRIDGAVPPA